MDRDLNKIETLLQDSNITSGLELLQKILSKHKNNPSSLSQILEKLYSVGQSLIQTKQFKPIFPLFQILSKLCLILSDSSKLCDIKNNLSYCYRASGQSNLALKECLEALEIAGDNKSLYLKLPALHLNACAIYREDLKDLTIAKTHAELAYFFAKENGNNGSNKEKRSLAISCYNYALVLEELKDFHNAIVWYREGLRFCEEKWNDLYMEQVFREKVNNLNSFDVIKKPVLFKKRATSQKANNGSYKYSFAKEIEKINNRPGTYKKRPKKTEKKYSLTPISNKNLTMYSVNTEKTGFYNEDYRIKIRNSQTPMTYVRAQKYKSETYKTPIKSRLSLVQSVIKIQKWFRKLVNKENIYLKSDYLTIGKKFIENVKYFVSVYKEINTKSRISNNCYFIEAWPLVSNIVKPLSIKVDLSLLCNSLQIPCDESVLREKDRFLLHCISVEKAEIVIKKIQFVYSGEKKISNEIFSIIIYLYDRNLEIEASNDIKRLNCVIKLDPLQDINHIQSKIPMILDNLVVRSEVLLFNLN